MATMFSSQLLRTFSEGYTPSLRVPCTRTHVVNQRIMGTLCSYSSLLPRKTAVFDQSAPESHIFVQIREKCGKLREITTFFQCTHSYTYVTCVSDYHVLSVYLSQCYITCGLSCPLPEQHNSTTLRM